MKKSVETILYSTLGIAAVFLILVAVNFLIGRIPKRMDLTAEKAYTLSAGTRAILAKFETPIKIRFYCTRNENMPPQLKLYAQQVEDLLAEYRQASKGLIEIQKLDPEPDSDAEDSAKLDGVEAQMLTTGEPLYLGLSASLLDQKEPIPFLTPGRERLLEYDISRTISRLLDSRKQVVGIMSSLPVAGQPKPQIMMQVEPGKEPWALFSELKRDFEVKQVEMTADRIPGDISILVVIHPRKISDTTQYAIDQFILRGGKLIAFLDPSAVLDSLPVGGYLPASSNSNMEKLLTAWGIKFDSTKAVADMNYLGRSSQGREPGLLALNDAALSKDDVLTANASNLYMVFAGAFSGTPAPELKETILIKSSPNAQLVNPRSAQTTPEEVINHFTSANTEYPLAIRLTGKFKTAFPDGPPNNTADKKGDRPQNLPPGRQESIQETTVVLVGDSDMLQNQISVIERQNTRGERMFMPSNGNLPFAQSAVEQLAGDNNLMAMRGRATRERPFTVVQQLKEAAEASYRGKIKTLEASLAETQRKLSELQQRRQTPGDEADQRFILSPEQQIELQTFRRTEASVKKELKDVRRNLRTETDSLENRIKWLNIAAMPAAVTLAGLGLALVKRKRNAAK